MTEHRVRMVLDLAGSSAPDDAWPARAVSSSDGWALGELMFESYRGTVDDEGETLEDAIAEAEQALEGKYGPVLSRFSPVIEEGGRLLAAVIVTLSAEVEGPLLAFALTNPERQRRGMGTYLIRLSAHALAEAGHERLTLVVTRANPAVSLYERLGFRAAG